MLAVIGDSGNAGSIAVHARAGFRHVGTLRAVGLQARPLGRHGDDAAPARAGRGEDAAPLRSQGRRSEGAASREEDEGKDVRSWRAQASRYLQIAAGT